MSAALFIDAEVGEIISIENGRILLKVEKKTFRKVRLSFTADRSISICREAFERKEMIKGENKITPVAC
jgi:hypothetical protein